MKNKDGKLYCSIKDKFFEEYIYRRGHGFTDFAPYCPHRNLRIRFNKDHKFLYDKGSR